MDHVKKLIMMLKFNATKRSLLGPFFWMSSTQFFIAQIVVSHGFSTPYSLRFNRISDLGATSCGSLYGGPICSPMHALINGSLILFGFTIILGAALISKRFVAKNISSIGFSSIIIAGIGTTLTGLIPENISGGWHLLGSAVALICINVGIVLLGLSLDLPRPLKILTLLMGIVSLIATLFYASGSYGPLGAGGVERVAAYLSTVWLVLFGAYLSMRFIKVE